MPTILDHGLAALFGVVVPALGVVRARAMLRGLRAGRGGARTRAYAETIVLQWLTAGLILGLWAWRGRSWVSLGVGAPAGALSWITLGLVGVAGGAYVFQIARVRASAEARGQVREQLGGVASLLPRTPGELRAFLALGVTAGVCEELLYRGFLMWWGVSIGAPVWAAILISSAAFGAGHAYQGADSALRIFSLGVVFSVIVTLTQTIWIPVAAHALIDVASGITAYIALREGSTPDPAASPSASATPDPAR